MNKKYPHCNTTDTSWDAHHKQHGQMTNQEFFSSNGKGGFYEGLVWDGDEWVPNAATQARQHLINANKCDYCGCEQASCHCC